MNKALDKFLCNRFPHLYKDRNGDPLQTAMVWGFSCGDGWFQILFDLSEEITVILKKMDEGFEEATLATKEPRRPATDAFAVTQVKEKFGTLRFYVNGTSDEINAAIRKAECRSAETCEECGDPGVLRGRSWLRTACVKCAKGVLPVGCDTLEVPCGKGTPGCYHDHAAEDAAEEADIAREKDEIEKRTRIEAEDVPTLASQGVPRAAKGGLRPPTAKELDPHRYEQA